MADKISTPSVCPLNHFQTDSCCCPPHTFPHARASVPTSKCVCPRRIGIPMNRTEALGLVLWSCRRDLHSHLCWCRQGTGGVCGFRPWNRKTNQALVIQAKQIQDTLNLWKNVQGIIFVPSLNRREDITGVFLHKQQHGQLRFSTVTSANPPTVVGTPTNSHTHSHSSHAQLLPRF